VTAFGEIEPLHGLNEKGAIWPEAVAHLRAKNLCKIGQSYIFSVEDKLTLGFALHT